MTFSAEAWTRNLDLYEAIRTMPFNRELSAGTLSLARFQHYIVQDAHYLVAFGQALAMAAAKADDPDHILQFARATEEAIVVERGLHATFFQRFGLDADTARTVPLSPTCHHYASFLIAAAFREPLPVVLAAMLPCFWIYREIGQDVLARAAPNNPFQDWIDTYGGDDFSQVVDRMIDTTDAIAAGAGEVS